MDGELSDLMEADLRAVSDLLQQGWTEYEIEDALRRQREFREENQASYWCAGADTRVKRSGSQGSTNFTTNAQEADFVPLSDTIHIPLLDKIKEKHLLENLVFSKKRMGGVGFKVTSDAFGFNAVVSRVKDPKLLNQGLCIGAIVTHIEDMCVLGKDHFDILQIYRQCIGDFSIKFAIPGLEQQVVDSEVVRKGGHKVSVLLILIASLLTMCAISTNQLQQGEFKSDSQTYDLIFRWNVYECKLKEESSWLIQTYSSVSGNGSNDGGWKAIDQAGGLFFGFSILGIILYMGLAVLGVILATRRPRALITEMGETLRTSFIIINLIVCLTSITTWSAWIATYDTPDTVRYNGEWLEVTSSDLRMSTSIILQLFGTVLMVLSVFTSVLQK